MTTRRALLTATLFAAPTSLLLSEPARAALPTVDMEALLKAAQWDPVKLDTGIIAGAGASVLQVEKALVAKGLLAASYADGHYGSRTVAAYKAWQESLGYSGIGANGIPGPASLAALATNRFAVVRPLAPGAKVAFRGVTINSRTRAMLLAAEGKLGFTFVMEQGSYNPGGDVTSAGTHDGGGVVDLDVVALTSSQRTAAATALRQVGFAAWVRSPAMGNWDWHIHAVAISDTDLAPQAQKQVGAYYEGRNGLANNAPDDGPKVTKVTWEEYQRSLA